MSAIARPPIGEGPIAVTAYAIRALKAYAPPGRAADMNERIARATAWLAARDASDRLKIATCSCSGCCGRGAVPPSARRSRSRFSRSSAPTEGGRRPTTCRATRTRRVCRSSRLPKRAGSRPSTPRTRRESPTLLSNQRPDGSWYVKSRAVKFQPYLDGGFPYEHDQWISSMATGWATAALTLALP